MTSDDGPDGPPRGVLVAAVIVAVAAVIGVLVFAMIRQTPPQQRPVAIVSVPAPQAGSDACHALVAGLPDRLGDYQRVPAAEPAPVGAAAWRANPDGEPVILRCGLEQPVDFVAGTPVQVVDDVDWFRIGDEGRSTWITVDRPVYVALTLPDGSGPTPIQLISTAVAAAMPAVPVNPRPVR
ncbi:DUF3515 domain-containing protein [Mycobacterium sp. URHB0044]|uniref:DUF3515 domain-containing protein n=1 Tax=Mycobacterium sp. URHB0044 TaxID=1380386 RepID=UPI00048F0F99|nr:DUF3515 domain-containing protein [Mycobacterium sp. URHB0044]